jgi:hypothetical protein
VSNVTLIVLDVLRNSIALNAILPFIILPLIVYAFNAILLVRPVIH